MFRIHTRAMSLFDSLFVLIRTASFVAAPLLLSCKLLSEFQCLRRHVCLIPVHFI